MSTPTEDPGEASAPNLESILRRVRKLLAIAEDSRADPNEAAAAAQQAERIMRKYQIDNADVLLRGMQSGTEFGECGVGTGNNPFDPLAPFSRPASIIAVAVAKLHDCQTRISEDARKREFVGLRIDAILARFTYLMLVNNMAASADIWKQRNKAKTRERDDYIAGYAHAVCALLREAKAAKDAEQAVPGAGTALVLAKPALVRAHYGAWDLGRGISAPGTAAAGAGYADGRHADVGRRGMSAAPAAPQVR